MKTDCVKAFPHERTREDTVEIIEMKILDDSSESELDGETMYGSLLPDVISKFDSGIFDLGCVE